jgi:hypothetical protein
MDEVNDMKDYITVFLLGAFIAWMPAAWITHLIVCFSDEKWGFLIGGAIFFPVAVVHGTGLWFGAW